MKFTPTKEEEMSATQMTQIQTRMKELGFIFTGSDYLHGNTSYSGRVLRAPRRIREYKNADRSMTVTVTFNANDEKLVSYSYSGGRYNNGGARVQAASRRRDAFTNKQLMALFLRNVDEIATGCRWMCENRDGEIFWVRQVPTTTWVTDETVDPQPHIR